MPLLFVIFFAVLVNFPSSVQAQQSTTKIRGPRSSDVQPAPQSVGPLSPSDTLWRVAERIRPEPGISLYQVMYALYLKNPEAFLDNNLNHLRPGAVLVLPSVEEIKQVELALARQKSEQDDKDWAARQKNATRAAKSPVTTSETQAPENTTPAKWQAELAQLGQQQRQDLDGLRTQFADSLQQIQAIVDENMQLRTSLLKVEQELALIKAQLGDDAAMQQQIEQLLKQQAELLQAKAADDAAIAASEQTNGQQWLKHPLAWVLAASIPALLVLFGILLWVKKRSRHTEDVVQAAVTEPAIDPAYHSPLPPLDNSNDLDESLFEIDDALLEDAFGDSTQSAEVALDDDMLEFDDALSFEDDSLLPPEASASNSAASDELDEFDPDNILSDTDLSALLAAEDDDDAVIELADDDLLETDAFAAKGADAPTDEALDDALSPAAEPAAQRSEADMFDTEEFDIDDLIEEIDLDDTESDPPVIPAPQLQEQQLTQAMTTPEPKAADPVPDIALNIESDSFDSSVLEEFAESLVSEDARKDALTADDADDAEVALLNAELTELLDQVAADSTQAESAQPDTAQAEQPQVDISATKHAVEQDDDILLIDEAEETNDDADDRALDLTASDDESVVRPTEASLSVENPSKMLEQYPELELTDDDLISQAESELLDMPELDAELLLRDLEQDVSFDTAPDGASHEDRNAAEEPELDPMPDTQFDSLMSELEAMADNLDTAQQHEQAEQHASSLQLQDDALPDSKLDITDDDFLEIDSLLANAEQQEQDSERFNQLNVDVGLDDYADIIGEHERRDVDSEDNGYSAKLDLVRAYIEIDDRESAELLLDDILASDAPAHVKTEAQSLKQ